MENQPGFGVRGCRAGASGFRLPREIGSNGGLRWAGVEEVSGYDFGQAHTGHNL